MSLPKDDAIVFDNVTKVYRLYRNKWEIVTDVLGFKSRSKIPEFFALKNINLTVKKGERIGLVGRNGAGKSTLLKLITGNFNQTSGDIIVNGKVQALMNTGIGFHPEFSGLENIKASLLYNGLNQDQLNEAVEEIIDFVELGEFLDQPLKTYSLGMKSRIFFAVSTAIQPEILIIDEVLGAGDAYFSAKSADRMKKLTSSGCTLILVSHSSQQVLQFCDRAIWLESGEIVMENDAISVIKAYEEYSKKLETESISKAPRLTNKSESIIQSKWLREKLLNEVLSKHITPSNLDVRDTKSSLSLDIGTSRWPSLENGLKIERLALLNHNNECIDKVRAGESLSVEYTIRAEEKGVYDVFFVLLLFTEDGRWLSRHCSEKYSIELAKDERYKILMHYNKVLLGNGKYIFSAAIYKTLDLNNLSDARYYDLLSRSFEFKVEGYYNDDDSLFYHPAEWITNDISDATCKQEINKELIEV